MTIFIINCLVMAKIAKNSAKKESIIDAAAHKVELQQKNAEQSAPSANTSTSAVETSETPAASTNTQSSWTPAAPVSAPVNSNNKNEPKKTSEGKK